MLPCKDHGAILPGANHPPGCPTSYMEPSQDTQTELSRTGLHLERRDLEEIYWQRVKSKKLYSVESHTYTYPVIS